MTPIPIRVGFPGADVGALEGTLSTSIHSTPTITGAADILPGAAGPTPPGVPAPSIDTSAAPSIGSLLLPLLAGSVVLSVALGIRQTFGLFLGPFGEERGLSAAQFAFAVALHNLTWGLFQPVAGALSDRFGTAWVVGIGAVAYALGLGLAALVPTQAAALVGLGVLTGVGTGCTAFGVVVTAIGRIAPPEQRSGALGIASAGGSVGMIVLVPLVQVVLGSSGLEAALLLLGGVLLAVAPLGIVLDRAGARVTRSGRRALAAGDSGAGPDLSAVSDQRGLRPVLAQAAAHPGFQLLTLGFFTCGFQLAFITTHLPGHLVLCHLPTSLGATALALIGLFNVFGSWGAGCLGHRFRPQLLLAWLYLARGAAILLFLLVPPTEASVLGFAMVMGLLWLSTVPLTNGLIARMFGVQHLGTLFGICFLSHQVGSFLGAWLGGYVFDLTGSYSLVWALTAAAGLFAAAVNVPITDRPAARLAVGPG